MNTQSTLNLNLMVLCVSLFLFGNTRTFSQLTVEFRIVSVTTDLGDMDPDPSGPNGGNSDPHWDYSITDIPFANAGNGSTVLTDVNCPGTVSVNDVFFSQSYPAGCNTPTEYTFFWETGEEDLGSIGTWSAYSSQSVSIPAISLTYPNASWTTISNYSNNAVGVNCAAGSVVSWKIELQYRTIGTPETIAPTITCPNNTSLTVTSGSCSATAVGIGPLATNDNCGVTVQSWTSTGTTVMSSPLTGINTANGSSFNLGASTVTYTVFDAANNSSSCSFDVTVVDNITPVITCPSNQVVSANAGVCGENVIYTAPVGTDNCPSATTSLLSGPPPGGFFPVGTTTVTYQVVDLALNSAQCSFDITVEDNELPTITCPSSISTTNDVGLCGATVNFAAPVGVDNCSGAITSLLTSLGPGAFFPIGTSTITYQVLDASANSAQCSFNVVVTDNENPVINCPSNFTVNNTTGLCGATVTYATPVGTDNCFGASTSMIGGLASSSFFPIGTTTVSYKVTDASANTNTCNFQVTVVDAQLPSITCPSNITVNNLTNLCGQIVTYMAPVGTDNCPGATTSMTAGLVSLALFPGGVTTQTFEAVDASGNTVSCSFTVTVTDAQNPNISCPSSVSVNNDPGDCGAIVNYGTPVFNDNCPGSVLTQLAGLSSGSFFPIGTTLVTFQVQDVTGNNAQCSFTVDVNDTEPPLISCPSNITIANDAGLCGATVNYSTPIGVDNCPGSLTSLSVGLSSGAFFSVGTTTVTYEVVDASGNTGQCSFDITVNDTQNPTITCPANISTSNDVGSCGALINFSQPVVADNCPGLTSQLLSGQLSGTFFPIGTTTQLFEVTDASGNTTQCTFDVTVTDNENPTITCPSNVSVSNSTGNCGAVVSYLTPVGIDNCAGSITSMLSGQASNTFFLIGITSVTYQTVDAAGNLASCSFNVEVNDAELPVISCPPDLTIPNDAGVCGATIFYAAPVGLDNCPGSITSLITGQASGTLFPVGVTPVTYEVIDASANTAQCTFSVTITDTEFPTILCPSDITQSNDAGVCGATINYSSPAVSDNCSGTVTSLLSGLASGSLFPIGTTAVTYEVEDASGNSAQCSFNITINDTETPSITCPSSLSLVNDPGICGAAATYLTPIGTDNCAGVTTSMTAGLASGSTFPIGITNVTFEAVDAAGNTNQCTFFVAVTDGEQPTISCPSNSVVSNTTGLCEANVSYVVPIGSDNCPGASTTLISGLASGSAFPVGITTVTYEVADVSGNSAQCSFDVMVNDIELPVISCPTDITTTNFTSVCGAVVDYIVPVGSDNCPGATTSLIGGLATSSLFNVGTTTVTYQVTDASSNVATCSFDVTIVDAENPTITCPSDQNVFFNSNCQYILQNYVGMAVAADNCGIASIVQSPASGTVLSSNQLVTLITTDVNGNVANCSFNVFVSDSTSPSLVCPPNQNVFFDASCQFILPDYTFMAVTSDNCGAVTVSQFPVAGTAITGSTTITLTADDGNGNTSSCTFDVLPTDNILPAIGCPGNQNVAFNSTCQYALLSYTGMAVAFDNCGPLTITQSPVLGTLIADTATITLTVIDGAGNLASCAFNVNPSDQTIPQILCPPNQNVFFDANCQYTLLDYTGLAAASDNCGPITVTQNPPVGTVISIATTVTLTVLDGAGNSNSCSFDVIPTDNIPPVISCPIDQIVSMSAACDFSMTDFTGLATATDNCSIAAITQSLPIGTIITTTQPLTLMVSDNNGNTDQCTFNVIPMDDTAPTLTCPVDVNVDFNNLCQFVLIDYTFGAVVTDNCGSTNLSQFPVSGTVIVDTTVIAITATDGAGNTTTCNFNVNPSDNSAPVITSCPLDQNEYVGLSCKYTIPDYTGLLVGSDNCGTMSVSQVPVGGTDISTNTIVTLIATDGNGNNNSCTFNVLLSDTISPSITCPLAPVDVYFDVNCEYILLNFDSLTSPYDNCGTTVVSQLPPVGAAITANQTMTMIVTDASGNTGQCMFNLVPQDTIAPIIGCPGNQTVYRNDSCYAVIDDYTGLANTTANCEAVIVTQDPLPGTVINSTTTILLYGTDASGNVSQCTFSVVLADTTAPEIVCPPDIYSCKNVITFALPTATDNCSSVTVTRITGMPSGSTFPDGTILQTYVATDASGNTDTCTFKIHVFVKPEGVPVVSDISCYGEVDGYVDLTVNSGNPPFLYEWSNLATTEDIFGLSEGGYQCIITDTKGCTDTVNVDIVEPDSLWIDEQITDISCYGEIDGKVFVTIMGGNFPYTYSWNPLGAGNAASNLPAGNYTLTLVDARGCTVTESYTVAEPDSISLNETVSFYPQVGYQISTENGSDGSIDLSPTGGNPPYNYLWETGESTSGLDNLIAGTYTVIVTDTNGCEQTGIFVLDQPLAPVFYTGLSPNGDGFNDFFVIKNVDRYPNNRLTIMNRWGDVVYQKYHYNNEWDGMPNKGAVIYGNKVPEGSYYYVFELVEGEKERLTGYIVIKR